MSVNETLRFCDWRIEIYNCVMSDMFRMEAMTSLITYGILAITGSFIFGYRYKHMWKGLFINHCGGIRPLPVDSLLFFWTIACYLRALHSLLMILDVYTTYLQKETVQEIGWTVLCYGAVTYIIGIIYTIPANYSRGLTSSKSRKSRTNNSNDDGYKIRTIYIPSPTVLNIVLLCWCLYPTLTCFPFAILSGIARDNGDEKLANNWTMAQYIAYSIHDLVLSAVGIYYGINFMLILRQSVNQFKSSTAASSSATSATNTNAVKSSANYYQSNGNVTREALDRLKYTMTYIAILPLVAAPWWFTFGVYRQKFITVASFSNLFLSSMWHVTGVQPLVAVCQYVLVKRVYQHYKSNKIDNGGNLSNDDDNKGRRMSDDASQFSVDLDFHEKVEDDDFNQGSKMFNV
ncbi:22101_t:CDS:2 [Entrophospora sp. SA101]|nr:13511_t:CDS:2 [Entrophospora sp. SA101]CAJ0631656.1 6344_t:CDS:2 [Entrophospora sp. SA101]CAJ0747137.1 22101_t:CDS:2 [Entrophospora sp. SA101]CAJ0830492.1 141_t:CDS:2 [Entrophospora sp. SA101]CAJ0845977.1 2750_t:CDS:2 [Entrophospora sp. SA101]